MKKTKRKLLGALIPTIVAIMAVAIIEIVALRQGIDGTMLALSYVLVGGLGGYKVEDIKKFISK